MRVSRLFCTALAALGLAACELEPGDPVFLSGRVLEADGAPWQGEALPLLKRLPPQPLADAGAFDPERESPFGPWRSVTPDAEGRFVQRLTGRDVGASFGHTTSYVDPTFRLQLPARADGAEDQLTFRLFSDAELPPLRRWDSALTQVSGDGGVQLHWAPAVSDEDLRPHEYEVQVHSAQGRAWRTAHVDAASALLMPELLEDFGAPEVRVSAFTFGQRSWVASRVDYELMHHSPRLPLALPGRIPESRGAACSVNGVALQPCPFTDGRLEDVALTPPATPDVSPALVLQLPAPLRPGRILVRGVELARFSNIVQVDGAQEGQPWQRLVRTERREFEYRPMDEFYDLERADLDLPLEGAPAVTQLRLRLLFQNQGPEDTQEFEQSLRSLREVSVFAAP
jgi:hypothetical protein